MLVLIGGNWHQFKRCGHSYGHSQESRECVMAGVDERVKGFLRSWEKTRESDLLNSGPLRCVVCDRELEDGGLALLDGGPVCCRCREKLKGE